MHAELKANGKICGHNQVARLMREEGLKGKKARRFKVTTISSHNKPVAPNLLARRFGTSNWKMNSAWVGDITYLPTREGWLYLATREAFWRVMGVETIEANEEDTFCAIVPGKHEFTLAGGVYTMNCGACEPECPVEAIFPEDALPEKWEPFVKINYAYPDADTINRLTDEYATEHNVQNEPIA